MGAWWYYSDNNDNTQDYALEVEKKVLPKRLREEACPTYTCKDTSKPSKPTKKQLEKYSTKLTDYWSEFSESDEYKKAKEETEKLLQKGRKTMRCWSTEENDACTQKQLDYIQNNMMKVSNEIFRMRRTKKISDKTFVGLALKLARGWESAGFGRDVFPKRLPKGYPCELANEAYDVAVRLLEELKGNKEGWKDPSERKAAIENEIVLFSGCEIFD